MLWETVDESAMRVNNVSMMGMVYTHVCSGPWTSGPNREPRVLPSAAWAVPGYVQKRGDGW
jgi:hypothetical protein